MARIILALIMALVLVVSIAPMAQADIPAAQTNISEYTGDVDGDGEVNIQDFSIIAAAYLSYPASRKVNPGVNARWDPRADLNGDGQVTVLDLTIMIFYYGT